MIYLDVAATTKPTLEAIQTFDEIASGNWFNPSSKVYSSAAYDLISSARSQIAEVLGAKSPEMITFTSGSTEAANQIINNGWDHIITSELEHPCVYNAVLHSSADVHYVHNFENGLIDLNHLDDLLSYCSKEGGKILVAVMGANNEIGTLQLASLIGALTHYYRDAYYFADMTQQWAHGIICTDEIDFACASGHKFGAFKGSGFIYCNNPRILKPLLYGGGQENSLRPGTENVGGIVAMSNAFKKSADGRAVFMDFAKFLREKIVSRCNEGGYTVNGSEKNILPNIVSFTLQDCDANKIITALALDEIYLSAGSACSTESIKPSRILKGIGLSDDEARRTLRISFDARVTEKDIDVVFDKIKYYRGVLSE